MLVYGGNIILDINQEKNHMRIYSTIFFVVAIFVLVIAFTNIYKAVSFNTKSNKTRSVISNIVTLYDKNNKQYFETLVSFKVGEKEYKNISTNTYVANLIKGDMLDIYYRTDNPEIVSISKKPYYLGSFLLFIGVTLLISSVLAHRRIIIRKKEIQRLLAKNQFIKAQIVDIQNNSSLSIGLRNPLYLKCISDNPTIIKIFYSDNIWVPIKNNIVGKFVSVYYEDNDFNVYYVDARDLYL